MPALIAQTVPVVSLELTLSVISLVMTAYFWLIKARRERPDLRVYQLSGFNATLRRGKEEGSKCLCLTQVGECGVLIANNSIRQSSILRFDCALRHDGRWLKGRWGRVNGDAPPWNVAAESTISLKLACFFDVPDDYEVPDDVEFRVAFITAGGQRFSATLHRQAPDL